mmetsp:Transcript_44582/g.52208  ORF Transcript_44582/g.52208 Transcript_44582/m.52208 type:complete len:432 (+) Transcript_44582:1581-2876(+)
MPKRCRISTMFASVVSWRWETPFRIRGTGGEALGRHEQLNDLTRVLYRMTQDSPSIAGAVWGRRIGILHKALLKRLRDVPLHHQDVFTAWPSVGTVLLLKALPHIFPVTDYRHGVVLPSLLYLTQTLVQCPIRNHGDLVTGFLIAALVVEYTREAHRVSPEVLAFLAGVLRLFVVPNKWNECAKTNLIPSLANVVNYPDLLTLRDGLVSNKKGYSSENPPKLSLELKRNASTNLEKLDSAKVAAGVFCATLHMIDTLMDTFRGKVDHSENELFSEIAQSLLCLGEDIAPKSKTNTPSKKKKKMSILPSYLSERLSSTVLTMTKITGQTHSAPLLRRLPPPPNQLKSWHPVWPIPRNTAYQTMRVNPNPSLKPNRTGCAGSTSVNTRRYHESYDWMDSLLRWSVGKSWSTRPGRTVRNGMRILLGWRVNRRP